jgi:dUTPase
MICNGDKLVQFVLLWQPYFKLEKVKKINTKTIRATKKFGSTGNK